MRWASVFSVARQIRREPSSVRIWLSFLDQRSRRRRGTAFLAALTSQQILGLRVRQAKPLATALVVDLAGWHRDVTEELTSFQVDLRMDGLGRADLRSEERRVGTEWVREGRSRWVPDT